jgi:hypothetical protein
LGTDRPIGVLATDGNRPPTATSPHMRVICPHVTRCSAAIIVHLRSSPATRHGQRSEHAAERMLPHLHRAGDLDATLDMIGQIVAGGEHLRSPPTAPWPIISTMAHADETVMRMDIPSPDGVAAPPPGRQMGRG